MIIYREGSLLLEYLYMLIGRNVKRLRKQQGALADFVDSNQKPVSIIEAGKA